MLKHMRIIAVEFCSLYGEQWAVVLTYSAVRPPVT